MTFRSPALALTFVCSLAALPAAASPLIGTSWDGPSPGTLADITNTNDFAFGLPTFGAGQYEIRWDGGITAWRDFTTIGYNDGSRTALFNPGTIASDTTLTFTANDSWTLWADTPSLSNADSTGEQWAFAQTGANAWVWGLEDIQIGYADGDWQDAFGALRLVSPLPTVVSSETTSSLPLPPAPPSGLASISSDPLAVLTPPLGDGTSGDEPAPLALQTTLAPTATIPAVPEPSTVLLIASGLGLAALRRLRA